MLQPRWLLSVTPGGLWVIPACDSFLCSHLDCASVIAITDLCFQKMSEKVAESHMLCPFPAPTLDLSLSHWRSGCPANFILSLLGSFYISLRVPSRPNWVVPPMTPLKTRSHSDKTPILIWSLSLHIRASYPHTVASGVGFLWTPPLNCIECDLIRLFHHSMWFFQA